MTKTFTIQRDKWRMGGARECIAPSMGLGETQLLNSWSGLSCCLGFMCKSLDPSFPIENHSDPLEAFFDAEMDEFDTLTCPARAKELERTLQAADLVSLKNRQLLLGDLAQLAMSVNDCAEWKTPEEAEAAVKALFLGHGWEVVFEGEYTERQRAYLRLPRPKAGNLPKLT